MSARNLAVKAAALGLRLDNKVHSREEEEILELIGRWKVEKIKGFAEGLQSRYQNGPLSSSLLLRELEQHDGSQLLDSMSDGTLSTNSAQLDTIDLRDLISEQKRLRDQFKSKSSHINDLLSRVSQLETNLLSFQLRFGDITQGDTPKLSTFSTRISTVERQTSQILASLQHLQSELAAKTQHGSTQIETSTIKQMSSAHEQMRHRLARIESDLAALRQAAAFNIKKRSELELLTQRIKTIANVKTSITSKPLQFSPIHHVQERLHSNALFFSDMDIDSIQAGLERGHVLLMGQPGTGKTSLLRHIHLFFDNPLEQMKIIFHSVAPDWTSYDILGGKKLFGTELGVHLGHLTEAVLQSRECDCPSMFLLDELNLAPPDEFLGGVMDFLETGQLTFADLSLVAAGCNSLRVPNNFRIIAACNNSQVQFRYPISPQLQRRFSVVDMNHIDAALERSFLEQLAEKLVKKYQMLPGDDFETLSSIMIETIFALRSEGIGSEAFAFAHSKDALEEAFRIRDQRDAADRAIAKWIVPFIRDVSSVNRDLIHEKIFYPRGFSHCSHGLLIDDK